MLQAYVDGAGTGDPKFLILAGYIATSDVWALSSDARCNTPCRFDIGSVDQDLRECCDASLFTSVGRGKRSNRRHEGGRPLDLRHRRGASTSEIHRIAGTATQRPAQRALFAASRRRSLSAAQAA